MSVPTSPPALRGLRLLLALAALVTLGGGSAATTATAATASAGGRACAQGARSDSLTRTDPGPIANLKSDASEDRTSTPWSGPGRIAGTTTRRAGRGRELFVCASTSRPRRVRSVGTPIRLRRGERVLHVAVADRWVAWATTLPGRRARPVVRWRRLAAGRGVSAKSLRGHLTALVPAVTGQVAVSVVDRGRQRISLLQRGRGNRLLVPSRRSAVSNEPRHGAGSLDVWLWEPRTLAIAPSYAAGASGTEPPFGTAAAPSFADDTPETVFELPSPRPRSACRKARGTTLDAASGRLRVQMTDTGRWQRETGIGDARTMPYERQHLRICASSGRGLFAGGVGYTGGDAEAGTSVSALIGDAVLATSDAAYTGGTNAPGETAEGVYAPSAHDGGGRPTAMQPHATSAQVGNAEAAAWLATRSEDGTNVLGLWVSDAAGVRQVPLTPPLGTSGVGPSVLLQLTGSTLRVMTGTLRSVPRDPTGVNPAPGPAVLSDVISDRRITLQPLPTGGAWLSPSSPPAELDATCGVDACEGGLAAPPD